MEPDKKKKKKRQKVKYNILFVPDVATADVKRFSMGMGIVKVIIGVVFLIIVSAFAYCYFVTNHIKIANSSISSLSSEVKTLSETNKNLLDENEELQEKLSILSETLSVKAKEEEERIETETKKFVPSGFPIQGKTTYDEEVTSFEDEPAAVFTGDVGANVIATAQGVVVAVEGNNRQGYVVRVDHQNGYFSVYRNGSRPIVEEGDEVTNTTELFNITQGHEQLIYQIIYNGEYIDPLGLMEIYG